MSINLSIKNASDEVVAALKLRAKQNHRSLQGELMAIIENAAENWLAEPEAHGLRETAAEWRAKEWAATAQRRQPTTNEVNDAEFGGREHDIEHLMELLKKGLPLGDRHFTRDEMHER